MQLSIPPTDPILDALLLCALPANAVILWREAVSANGNAGVELQNLQHCCHMRTRNMHGNKYQDYGTLLWRG